MSKYLIFGSWLWWCKGLQCCWAPGNLGNHSLRWACWTGMISLLLVGHSEWGSRWLLGSWYHRPPDDPQSCILARLVGPRTQGGKLLQLDIREQFDHARPEVPSQTAWSGPRVKSPLSNYLRSLSVTQWWHRGIPHLSQFGKCMEMGPWPQRHCLWGISRGISYFK